MAENQRLAFGGGGPYKHVHSTRGSRDPDSRAAPGGFFLWRFPESPAEEVQTDPRRL